MVSSQIKKLEETWSFEMTMSAAPDASMTLILTKYLYCIAWSLGMHLGVNLGLGGMLFWLGTV